MNRFKELDLVDRVPEELWMEDGNSVQEMVIKTIPKKKKSKKAKWLSEKALQIAEKREVKAKGEKERYTHLNTEFQRLARKIRKSSSVISAKKQRKTTEWERLEIVGQMVKHLSAMQETWVRSLGWEDPLEKEMASHSILLAGKSHGWRSLVGYSPWGCKE